MTSPNFDICFFGTPHGFEQITVQGGFALDVKRLLDFDTSKLEPSLGDNFLRVIERSYGGNFYRIISIYTPALEIDSFRPGGFCGVALILQNSSVSDSLLIVKLLVELLNSLKSLTTVNGKFRCNIRDVFSQLKIPSELNNLKNSLAADRADLSKVISNSTLFITAGKGLDFPSIVSCLNFVKTTHIASRFIDVCVIPDGLIAESGTYKSKANSIDLSNAFILITANESKTIAELNITTARLNELNLKVNSLTSELDNAKSRLSLAEGQLSTVTNISNTFSFTNESPTIRTSNVQPIKISSPNISKSAPTGQKLASSSEAIKNSKSFDNQNTESYSDFSIYLILYIIGFIALVFLLYFGFSYYFQNDSSSRGILNSSRSRSPSSQTQVQPVDISSTMASEPSPNNAGEMSVSSPPKPQTKLICNSFDSPKNDYIYKPLESTKIGFTDVANTIIDLCPPLKGCEDNLKEELVKNNPDFRNINDLKGQIIKVKITNECVISEIGFTAEKTSRKPKLN